MADIMPNDQEPLIDYQNRQIASKNRAIAIQESWNDISNDSFDADAEPVII